MPSTVDLSGQTVQLLSFSTAFDLNPSCSRRKDKCFVQFWNQLSDGQFFPTTLSGWLDSNANGNIQKANNKCWIQAVEAEKRENGKNKHLWNMPCKICAGWMHWNGCFRMPQLLEWNGKSIIQGMLKWWIGLKIPTAQSVCFLIPITRYVWQVKFHSRDST